MRNKTWSRNGFHNIYIESIRLEQPAIHVCDTLNGHMKYYTSVEYCPLFEQSIVEFNQIHYMNVILLEKFLVDILVVMRLSIKGLLSLNPAAPNGICVNTSSEIGTNSLGK